MQYLLILQKFTILELEVAVVVVGDRFLQLKEASEETDLGKEYLTGTIGKIYKNELDTVKSKEVCNRAVTNQPPQARAGRMISQVTALLQTSLLFCLSLKGYYSDTRDCPRFRSKNAQIQHKQKIKDYS